MRSRDGWEGKSGGARGMYSVVGMWSVRFVLGGEL